MTTNEMVVTNAHLSNEFRHAALHILNRVITAPNSEAETLMKAAIMATNEVLTLDEYSKAEASIAGPQRCAGMTPGSGGTFN